jgi:hypothetical protein
MAILDGVAQTFSRRRRFWPRLRIRQGTPEARQVIVASAGRVGSTWTCNLLAACGVRSGLYLMPADCLDRNGTLLLDPHALRHVEAATFLTWYKSHSLPPDGYDPARHASIRFVTILRDPRDVLVSAADYLAGLDVSLGGRGKEFAALSDAERIAQLIEEGDWFLEALERWHEWPHAIRIYYEDLNQDPAATLAGLLTACDLEPRAGIVDRAARQNSFAVRAGRSAGEEMKGSFLRKGIVGDWRNKFDERCLRRFDEAKGGRWRRLSDAIDRRHGSVPDRRGGGAPLAAS